VYFSRCLNVDRDGEEVMAEGKSYVHQERRNVQQYRKSDGKNKQIIGGRGPQHAHKKMSKIHYTRFPVTSA